MMTAWLNEVLQLLCRLERVREICNIRANYQFLDIVIDKILFQLTFL